MWPNPQAALVAQMREQVADYDAQGVTTPQGKCWTARAVINGEQFVRGLS
jgi:hypothetical protein